MPSFQVQHLIFLCAVNVSHLQTLDKSCLLEKKAAHSAFKERDPDGGMSSSSDIWHGLLVA
jgi:hypothetical protein